MAGEGVYSRKTQSPSLEKHAHRLLARRYYTRPQQKQPQVTRLGLVIPPKPVDLEGRNLTMWQRGRTFVDVHHLHFPRFVFAAHGSLAMEFREHRFNKVALPRFQHERLHNRYRDFMDRYPAYLLPHDGIMATFLDEARTLDLLNVCVKAVDMLDRAHEEGRVTGLQHEEERTDKMETARSIVEKMQTSEIVLPHIIKQVEAEVEQHEWLKAA